MFNRIACLITGADYKELQRFTPACRNKVTMLAILITLPTLVWAFIGFQLTVNWLGQPLHIGLLAAAGAAYFIFTLDRAIVLSNGRSRTNWFRLLMGIVVALLGALLIDGILFQGDIDLHRYGQEKTKAELSWEQDYGLLAAESARLDSIYQATKMAYQCEVDGTCGSRQRGLGPAALAKQHLMVMAERDALTARTKRDDHFTGKEAFISAALANWEANEKDGTLLVRLEALHEMIFRDKMMFIAFLLFLAIGVLIEIALIVMKQQSNETAYEWYIRAKSDLIKVKVDSDVQMAKQGQQQQVSRGVTGRAAEGFLNGRRKSRNYVGRYA